MYPSRSTQHPSLLMHDSSASPGGKIDSHDFSHELVPLGLATQLICARVYAGEQGRRAERLAGVAHLIAALAPLYTHSADGTRVRKLMAEELRSGNFRHGGAELHFIDGRARIDKLAVANRSVEEVVRLLGSVVKGEDRPFRSRRR
jgi:hypothetical protein